MSGDDWLEENTHVIPDDIVERASSASPNDEQPRAHLVGLLGPVAGQRHPIAGTLVIGRDTAADIRVRSRDLSRRHARVSRTPSGEFLLEDLGSLNGTSVNGERVASRVLRYGDVVQLGAATNFVFTHHESLDQIRVGPQHLGSITQLAGGIAHHFNNLMAVLQSNLAFLANADPSTPLGNPTLQDCLADLNSVSRQASTITSQLLGFARLGKYENRSVNLSSLLSEIATQIQTTHNGIGVKVSVEPGLSIRGDAGQLRQALLNLCENAREAIQGAGHLSIDARLVHNSNDNDHSPPAIVVAIRDSGHGMDTETQQRAFEPFFTTKRSNNSPDGATGLGLPAVYGIVKNHGGRIRMESDIGIGTAFYIHLPPADITRPGMLRSLAARQHQPGMSVLCIEHSSTARRELAELLDDLGYRVLPEQSGRDGVLRFLEERGTIGLAVVGVNLPDMDGVETARLLRRMHPTLPVLLTGKPGGSEIARLRDADAQGMLPQPFSRDAVHSAVARLIRSADLSGSNDGIQIDDDIEDCPTNHGEFEITSSSG